MKQVSGALAALIASAQFVQGAGPPGFFVPFDLYTFVLTSGLILTYTTADFPIAAPTPQIWQAPNVNGQGNLWFPGITWQPKIIDMAGTKATAHWKVGLDSDTWQVQIAPRPPGFAGITADLIGSMPWLQAAASGALDDADCIVSRAYFGTMPNWSPGSVGYIGAGAVPVGTLIMFRGYLGEVDLGQTTAILTINDYKQLLQQQMPRNLYGAACKHIFGDARCTINLASFTQSGVTSATSTPSTIIAQQTMPDPGGSHTYALGTMKMLAGANAGLSRFVMTWDGNATFGLLNPFPFAIAPGDSFSVSAGCDHTQATCNLYNNILNFRGETYIPAPEVSFG